MKLQGIINEALGVVAVHSGGGARIGGISVGTGFGRGGGGRGWGNWGNWSGYPYGYYYNQPVYYYATPTCVSPCVPAPGGGFGCYTSSGQFAYCNPGGYLPYSIAPVRAVYWSMGGNPQAPAPEPLGACAASERNMIPNPGSMGCSGPCVGGRCACWKQGGCACRKG